MRKSLISAASIAAAALVLAACGGGGSGETETATTDATAEETTTDEAAEPEGTDPSAPAVRGEGDLVIWADSARSPAIKKIADEYGAANGISVTVQTIVNVRGDLVTANQAGNGPDIAVGAHDWLGQFVANGTVDPLQVAGIENYAEQAVAAATYDNVLYAVPYGMESLVLYCNNETAPGAPFDTIDAAIAAAEGSGAALDTPLVLPSGNSYDIQPLYTSAGGYIFGFADGVWDVNDIGYASDAGIAAAEKIATLGETGSGVLKTSITNENGASIFQDGKAGCQVGGPWNYNDHVKALGEDGFTTQVIPGFEGGAPAEPFLGVNQFYVASNAQNKSFATDFVTSYVNTEDVQRILYDELAQPPAMNAIAEQVRGENPVMATFLDAAAAAKPMPAVPAMDAVWTPTGQAWTNIIGGKGGTPAEVMTTTAQTIRDAIAGS